jgi:hypothetical protein
MTPNDGHKDPIHRGLTSVSTLSLMFLKFIYSDKEKSCCRSHRSAQTRAQVYFDLPQQNYAAKILDPLTTETAYVGYVCHNYFRDTLRIRCLSPARYCCNRRTRPRRMNDVQKTHHRSGILIVPSLATHVHVAITSKWLYVTRVHRCKPPIMSMGKQQTYQISKILCDADS